MTLTWSAIGNDIILQDGTGCYNYRASGTIYAGQLVEVMGSKANECIYVVACSNADDVGTVGVANYTVTKGEYVGVWGPGNMVRVRDSGSVTVGDDLQSASDTEDGYLASRTAVASA